MSKIKKLNGLNTKYKIKIVQHEYEVRSCCRDF